MIDKLVGGGGGGAGNNIAAGGGAGGVRVAPDLALTGPGTYPVTVGGGGQGSTAVTDHYPGTTSVFAMPAGTPLSATGGGEGGNQSSGGPNANTDGQPGGSGGGANGHTSNGAPGSGNAGGNDPR